MSELSLEMGRRMRARRKELGVTQEQVASACRITKSTVCRYEKGVIEHPHRPTVEAIAKVLHTDPDWLYAQRGAAADGEAESSPVWPCIVGGVVILAAAGAAAAVILIRKKKAKT